MNISFLQDLRTAKSLHDVAYLLGYKPKSLSYVVYKKADRYKSFSIPKKSGGVRLISAPCQELKLLQKRLSDGLQCCWEEISSKKNVKRAVSHGFRRKYSIFTNASVHRGRRFVFNVDIRDFFDSINFGRVYGFFVKSKDFSLHENAAKVIAAISCHEGRLPQGSPCSPVISNLIGHILDVRLARLARKNGCSYSRYADDLTFSTNQRQFPVEIASKESGCEWVAGKSLVKIIENSGFRLNEKKTRMQYADSHQEVTGLTVNRRVNTNSKYRKMARAMTNSLLKTGTFYVPKVVVDSSGKVSTGKADGRIDNLQGIFGFIDWVDLSYRRVTNALKCPPSSICKTYKRFLMYRDFWASSLPVILCEGKTDSIYLRGAIRSLADKYPMLIGKKESGENEFNVRFFNYSYTSQRVLDLSGGAPAVKSFAVSYINSVKDDPSAAKRKPLILLIDNDSGGKEIRGLIRQVCSIKGHVDGMEDFYHLKANLYVVFTPIEGSGGESSIEDFFDPELLKEKIDGKTFNPSNSEIDVLSEYGKAVFAAKVVSPNVGKINFSNFCEILRRIEGVIKSHADLCLPAFGSTKK